MPELPPPPPPPPPPPDARPLTTEARLPCPVCLGVQMEKLRPVHDASLVLDRCPRCGGVWFDRGEVDDLRRMKPSAAWHEITVAEEAVPMLCHSCHASMPRDAETCPSCGWKNRLPCPSCGKDMERRQHSGLYLDVCRSCQGVWFDRLELTEIWNLQVAAVSPRLGERATAVVGATGEALSSVDPFVAWIAADMVVDAAPHVIQGAGAVLENAPQVAGGLIEATGGLAGAAVDAAPDVIQSAGAVLGSAPEVAGGLVEATGDLAGAVFEAIVSIIESVT